MPLAIHFRYARSAALGVSAGAFGLVFFGMLLSWISLFGKPAFAGLVVAQTLWMVLAMQVGLLLRNRLPDRWSIFAFVPAFLLGEYARSYLPWGGFAWGGLGYTLHDFAPLLRLSAFTGVWGLSLAVLAVNCLLAQAVLEVRSSRKTSWALLATSIALVCVPFALPSGSADGDVVKLALVQGNVPGNTDDFRSDDDEVFANHVALTETIEGDPDLVIWPEGAFDRDPRNHPPYARVLQDTVRRTNAPFAVGAITRGRSNGPFNSTLFFDADGSVSGQYSKRRLVPFGEWVPLRSFLQPLFSELDRIPVDLVAGEEATVFELPQGAFASVICYESTYPDLVRDFVDNGARLLVVSANFSSYDRTAAAAQHLAASQMRAAEHRMWLAHAAVSGRSAVIDPAGRVLSKTDLFEPALLEPEVRFATSTTVYARLGDWVVWLTAAAGFGAAAVGNRFQRHSVLPQSESSEDV